MVWSGTRFYAETKRQPRTGKNGELTACMEANLCNGELTACMEANLCIEDGI